MHRFDLGKFCGWSFFVGSLFFGAACADADGNEAANEAEQVGAVGAAVGANAWENAQALPTNANGFEGSPAASLATPAGGLVVARDKVTNRFRVSTFRQGPWSAWSDFGTKTFIAKPAVAALDGLYGAAEFTWGHQIAVVGIASDNQYHIRIGKLDTTPPLTSNPTLVAGHDWTVIPNSTYASPPAVTVHSGSLLVAGRKANNTLHLHHSVLAITNQSDYFTNVWGTTVAVPALPSGWVAQGDPAIASLGEANSRIIIVTRAVNNGQKRLYANTWDRNSFFGWVSVPLAGVDMVGEPAVEYGYELNKATVYVKGSDSRFYQSSGLNSSWQPFAAIARGTFATNPAAAGNFSTTGHHLVVGGLTSNQLLAVFSVVGEP
ncbi:MAG TPA: hypothetical protein VJV79_01855 [Polyangiaceae bacterium]|nr:hypothetical protein [Polyangiaceae bacterium]